VLTSCVIAMSYRLDIMQNYLRKHVILAYLHNLDFRQTIKRNNNVDIVRYSYVVQTWHYTELFKKTYFQNLDFKQTIKRDNSVDIMRYSYVVQIWHYAELFKKTNFQNLDYRQAIKSNAMIVFISSSYSNVVKTWE
jgi:thioredoxin-related protein